MGNQRFRIDSRRSVLQIYSEILDFCRIPQSRYRIMQASYTSYNLTNGYLGKLEKLHLLEASEDERKYVIAEKGHEFLRKWSSMMELLSEGDSDFQNYKGNGEWIDRRAGRQSRKR